MGYFPLNPDVRIVACVNAMAGLTPEQVDAIPRLIKWFRDPMKASHGEADDLDRIFMGVKTDSPVIGGWMSKPYATLEFDSHGAAHLRSILRDEMRRVGNLIEKYATRQGVADRRNARVIDALSKDFGRIREWHESLGKSRGEGG